MGETIPPIDCIWWHAFLLHLSLAAGERECKSVWENCVCIPILECVVMSRSSLKSKSEVFGCFSSTISRLLPINLKKVNKLTTPGLKKKDSSSHPKDSEMDLLTNSRILWWPPETLPVTLSSISFLEGEKKSFTMKNAVLYHSVTLFKYQE